MKWLIRIGLGNDSAKETFGLLEIPLGLDQLAEVRHGQAHGFGVLAPLDRFPQDLLVRLSASSASAVRPDSSSRKPNRNAPQ